MKNRICIITGATSGIGKATALGLAKMEATVVIVARDETRAKATVNELRSAAGNPRVESLKADLSSLNEVRQLNLDFRSRYDQLHVLINNAGVSTNKRSVTVDGFETVFVVNYLAPFLLTNLLIDIFKDSAPARIINVAGDYHRKASIQFEDLMSVNDYDGLRANNQAKLALILFTYELARRLQGTGVSVNCLHPGAVATGAPLKDPDISQFSRLMYRLVEPFFASPEKGAETSIYLATSPEVEEVSGKYFIKKRALSSSPESYDTEIAQRLWNISTELAGLTGTVV